MGVDRKNLAGQQVEIQDPEVGRIVEQKTFERFFTEFPGCR
jgi:hypothetical protein